MADERGATPLHLAARYCVDALVHELLCRRRSPPIASATAYMSRLEMEFPMNSTVCPRMTCRASLGVILWNPQALLGCLGMRREYASA